jgi:hypothetical protein
MKSEAEVNTGAISIRYDYDFSLYREIYHPISHIHIGHDNNIKIGLNRKMLPETFIVFLIKNIYPKLWESECELSVDFGETCINNKFKCPPINDEYFTENERKLFVLQ